MSICSLKAVVHFSLFSFYLYKVQLHLVSDSDFFCGIYFPFNGVDVRDEAAVNWSPYQRADAC